MDEMPTFEVAVLALVNSTPSARSDAPEIRQRRAPIPGCCVTRPPSMKSRQIGGNIESGSIAVASPSDSTGGKSGGNRPHVRARHGRFAQFPEAALTLLRRAPVNPALFAAFVQGGRAAELKTVESTRPSPHSRRRCGRC